MKSNLTRRVFRRILSSEPLVHHRYLHSQPRPKLPPHHGRARINPATTRTFLGLFQKPQRDIREPLLDPGMEKMLELDKRIHLIARLPPPEELVSAYRAFVTSKQKKKRPIEDTHAVQLLQTLQSLEERNEEGKPSWLTAADLNATLEVMAEKSRDFTRIHNKLARLIFQGLQNRTSPEQPFGEGRQKIIVRYITILCDTGDTKEARHVLEQFGDREAKNAYGPWTRILRGFSTESNEDELLMTIRMMEDRNIPFTAGVYRVMTFHYARRNDVAETKKWFRSSVFEPREHKITGMTSDDSVYRTLLEFCLRNDEMEWGQSILETGSGKTSEQHTWNAIFRAAAATGRSVDEIDRMITIMARRADEEGNVEAKPDIHTFNGLIRFALTTNDAYTAERYYALAEKWGAIPDAETYILQVEYRLAAGDIEGAQAAYMKLREVPINTDADWPVMNQMLRVLTKTPGTKHETILSLIDDLSDKRKIFPAETVLALCTYHLNRDEYFEIVDLLQTYAPQFSTTDRLRVRDLLIAFTLDPTTDTGRAWDTYMIFHQVFDLETHRASRNAVMSAFFARGRPDLATHVFTRMSRHVRADSRPDMETYVLALEGIAATAEAEALEVVHNLLKLDTETEPCTRLYNALMLAYAACDAPWRALEFWDAIATSDEGPSYNSLHIAFRACERAAFGHRRAKAIWERLRQTDVEIGRELFASYVGSLAGQQLFEEVKELVKDMAGIVVGGEGPDRFTIGTIYNAAFGVTYQERVEEWAKENYPAIWEELREGGFTENEMGIQQANAIDRSLRA